MDKCNEEGKCSGRGRSYLIEAVEGGKAVVAFIGQTYVYWHSEDGGGLVL